MPGPCHGSSVLGRVLAPWVAGKVGGSGAQRGARLPAASAWGTFCGGHGDGDIVQASTFSLRFGGTACVF